MIVVEKKPVPIYEMECYECKSRLRYKAAEVSMCRVVCPVCGVPLWAATVSPVGFEENEAEKCSCYEITLGAAICNGTKEREECFCDGDRKKCTFYKNEPISFRGRRTT